MKPKKKDIKKWCEALRSGEFKQTKYRLQDEDGFCCLGVACKIFIPEKDLNLNQDGTIFGKLPGAQKSPAWLINISGDFESDFGINRALSNLNDDIDLTFDEIADILEAVYIHEVLK